MPNNRQPRQRQRNQSGAAPAPVQASDYESDAHNYNHAHVPPPTRTNTDLNLSVLRRYKPSIRTILSIAANAVVYIFTPSTQTWEKSGIEGTMFVCEEEPVGGSESYCVVVLNRRGLENLILELWRMQDVERMDDLLILRFADPEGGGEERVMGLWIHEDKSDTREINVGKIQECWEKAKAATLREAERAAQGRGFGDETPMGDEEGGGGRRRISLSDLFPSQNHGQ